MNRRKDKIPRPVRNLAGIGLCGALALVGTARPSHASLVYNAGDNFITTTATSNSDGAFTYGYESSLNGPFTAYNASNYSLQAGTLADTSVVTVDRLSALLAGANPSVIYNPYAQDFSFSTVTLGAKELNLHPGAGGEYAVARFTSPVAATYNLAGHFDVNDLNGGGTDVYLDGALVPGGDVAPGHTPVNFSQTVSLGAGQTFDFLVGRGGDNSFSSDSTGFNATFTEVAPVPEASTYAMMGVMLIGLVAVGRRKKLHAAPVAPLNA